MTWVFMVLLLIAGCENSWRTELDSILPRLGHRNWILIADSAYPAQSGSGVTIIATQANFFEVLQTVLNAIDESPHVSAAIYLDSELRSVPEGLAPGIKAFREKLLPLLQDRSPKEMPHMELIGTLDTTSTTFEVLVLKTTLALPYTSVFIELDCGYWGPDEEKQLREAMKVPSPDESE